MSRCPFAVWRGPLSSGAYSTAAQAGGAEKIGLVFHVIVGSEDSADGEFHQGAVHLSAHFGIVGPGDDEPEGTIVQWVDTDDIAYAQTEGNWPPDAYLSCETAGDVTTPLSPLMLSAAARLAAWCATDKGFPLVAVDHGQPGVTTHCHYPSGAPDPAWGNHPCPGPLRVAQIPALLALIHPSPPVPLPPVVTYPEDKMKRTPLNVTLDPNGNGYADLLVPFATVVALLPNGADPAGTHAYSPTPRLSALAEGAATRVVAEGGPPNGIVLVLVTTAT